MRQFPPMYATPQTNSPAPVQSPQHDAHGRPIYGQPASGMGSSMYYPQYSLPHQQTSYSQHVQHNPMHTSPSLIQGPHSQPLHQSPHADYKGLTGSPKSRMPQTPHQRPPSGLGASQTTPQGPPGSAGSMHPGNSANVNPNAAPGPIPATTPLVVRQDQNGVQWIAFEYSRDRVKMEYTIRCDVESVNVEELPQDFKTENCVYPRACCHKDQYKGNRLHYETECNTVGWALAQLNPCLRGKRGLIQRAVDSWRNSNQDPRLRSRRVRRMAKITNRKAVQGGQHGPHMTPSAPGSAGIPNSAGLPGAPGSRPGMGMGGQLHHHHEHPGGAPGSSDDVSGSSYDQSPQTHHHGSTNGQGISSPNDVRPAHSFSPTYPSYSSAGNSSMPSIHGSMDHVGGHAHPHSSAAPAGKRADEERMIALFGDLPEAKRRKFILVDDAQRGTRVRVRVMLDQVNMDEIPDSYRKSNSVFPRSCFDMQTASPPASPRGTHVFTSDPEDEREAEAPVTGRTLVPVPTMDGGDIKLPKPRITRTKRSREVTLNELGYRMSWSQGRVFAGRTLFLQRSLDAYRNKMRSTMMAAGHDIAQKAPHFDTRVGKKRWMERSKRSKRASSP
ncbi:hypothetical protein EJ05DRAFT_499592 [Pseudovirgaria hyperparasitica]|uniref:DUF8032 domain-containing protein n=1 Tax=Pseudovirgaria hyperparasitica TaxID=470096 RepID=A0A6A6WAG7_9PEZI|nr:uncharacterized protein EJ05DRAFT_499592 [Pseudovirgaria hyperparasitica]KAF2759169.1 hypothetical protein EJ05DRAFT_499592 [Pseudovirgaria hyperparasitica]